jgi:hypothetical protein
VLLVGCSQQNKAAVAPENQLSTTARPSAPSRTEKNAAANWQQRQQSMIRRPSLVLAFPHSQLCWYPQNGGKFSARPSLIGQQVGEGQGQLQHTVSGCSCLKGKSWRREAKAGEWRRMVFRFSAQSTRLLLIAAIISLGLGAMTS